MKVSPLRFSQISAGLAIALSVCLAGRGVAQPAPRQESFGVATHFGNGWHDPDSLIPKIKDAGFGWIRDEVFLDQVEPEPGKLVVPDQLNRWVGLAGAAGLKICLVLNVSPGARSHSDDKYDSERYARAAEFLVVALKGRIGALEVLNEPNASGFAQYYGGSWNGKQEDGSDSPWIGKYVSLINKTAERVKAANPELKVIGLGAVPPANYRMLRQGISAKVDGVVEHPYSFRTVPEVIPYPATPEIIARDGVAVAGKNGNFASFIEMLRKECSQTGSSREIWLTEWGYTTYLQNREAMHQPSTEEAQAAYALRRFIECLGLGVRLSVYYDIRDDGADLNEPEHHFGLLRHDGSPKPAYHALKRLFAAVDGWTPATFRASSESRFPRKDREPVLWDGARLENPDALICHEFRNRRGEPSLAIWSAERFPSDLAPLPAKASLELDRPGKITAATAYEPLTDSARNIPFKQKGLHVELPELLVPAHPLLIELKTDESLPPPTAHGNAVTLESDSLRLNKGEEFPGANGAVSLSVTEGVPHIELAYDFRDGGKYVEAQIARIPEFERLQTVRFKARGDASIPLLLRLVDQSGEIHQYPLPALSAKEWHSITVDVGGSHESWDGDGNGRIDLPMRSAGLGVRNEGDAGTAGCHLFTDPVWE